MPCDSIVLNTVELKNVKDIDLLEKALREEFGSENVWRQGNALSLRAGRWQATIANGEATSQMPASELAKIVGRAKQAYARQCVAQAAQRFGWAVQRGPDKNRFAVVKRG